MRTEFWGHWYRGRWNIDYKLHRLGLTQDFLSCSIGVGFGLGGVSFTVLFWTVDYTKLKDFLPLKELTNYELPSL